MDKEFVLLFVCVLCVSGVSIHERALDTSDDLTDITTMDLRMRGAAPTKPDSYICTGYKVEKDNQYIVKFEALADAGTAHHILVFGCKLPAYTRDKWSCGQVCTKGEQIMFAWAKNAPPLKLPKDVGRHIGSSADVDYIVLQIHYARVFTDADQPDHSGIRIYLTQERQKYIAGIYLLLAYDLLIPANTSKVHADISCRFNWDTSIYPFGYRTHAHTLGRVISGYRVRDNTYEQIGKGNPQWPQAFYPVGKTIEVKPGDVMTAQCTYSSIGRNRNTTIGGTHNDEMCNFYIMYYMDAAMEKRRGRDTCAGNNVPLVTANLPADSDMPLPPNPLLEENAKGHVSKTHVQNSGENPQLSAPHNAPSEKGIKDGVVTSSNTAGKTHADSKDNHYIQGNRKLTASDSDDYSALVPRPNPYLSDYDYPDYYDIMRQRMRVKKPMYDELLGSRMNAFSDYSEPSMMANMMAGPSKSRNRNKFFEAANRQYNDYGSDNSFEDILPMKNNMNSDSSSLLNPPHDPSGQSDTKASNSDPTGESTPKTLRKQATDANAKTAEANEGHAKMNLKFVSSVPASDSNSIVFGEIGGVATNEEGDVYVFHRGSVVWNSLSFNLSNVYQQKDRPVAVDPIVILSTDDVVKRSFGKNMFYLPHGLTVDKSGNIWVTDVALHQVFRFPAGSDQPDIILGERFVPGNDQAHFCKPTDVAVMSTGEFFVSDGYCNARIMKFDRNGEFLKQWGTTNTAVGGLQDDGYPAPYAFNVPNSLTIAEDRGLVCVADRENGRIQCFDLDGTFVREMHPPSFGAHLYAIEYCPLHGGVLFAVNGPDYSNVDIDVQGFTIEIDTGKLRAQWNIPTKGLTNPRDVTVHSPSHVVYVGELNPPKVWKFKMASTVQEPSGHPKMNLKFVSSVPASDSDSAVFGQIGGVATNEEGDVYVFHRGSVVWNSLSFNLSNVYQLKEQPVAVDAIVILSTNDVVKRSFGKNMFYLPHGLTVDKSGNIWVTDVALHQVFRFPAGSDIPDITVGEKFVPGNDQAHFCKPTDVAVMSTGEFFVSDGYCNSRIMKFDRNGVFLKQWGTTNTAVGRLEDDGYPAPYALNVPHSLTIAEDRGLLCVADRENGRIQCFDLDGTFVRQMHPPSFGAYLYAIEYCPLHGGVLFAVNGPDYSNIEIDVQGFTLEIDTGKLRAQWNIPTKGLTSPHDVTVHSPSHVVYVGELNPPKVWKFEMTSTGQEHSAEETTKATVPGIVAVSNNVLLNVPAATVYREPPTGFVLPTAKVVNFNDGSDISDTELPDMETRVELKHAKKIEEEEEDNYAPSLIIGLLLVVPVVLLVIITVLVRLYQTGHLGNCSKRKSGKKIRFNLGNILNSHKGFDRLSTEDDDHDIDIVLEDSDQEEFNITKNSKA